MIQKKLGTKTSLAGVLGAIGVTILIGFFAIERTVEIVQKYSLSWRTYVWFSGIFLLIASLVILAISWLFINSDARKSQRMAKAFAHYFRGANPPSGPTDWKTRTWQQRHVTDVLTRYAGNMAYWFKAEMGFLEQGLSADDNTDAEDSRRRYDEAARLAKECFDNAVLVAQHYGFEISRNYKTYLVGDNEKLPDIPVETLPISFEPKLVTESAYI